MARWTDQQEVAASETLCHFYIGNGLSAEVEKVIEDGRKQVPKYRLTVGSLFASESVIYPYSMTGLEDLLKTLAATRNAEGPTTPVGEGKLEPREHRNDNPN